jgi:predicted RNA binding protein YcfA (HicA-like mRNA interferase family)
MSKITPISYKILCKVVEAEGFTLLREKGDHLIYVKEGVPRPLVIPKHESLPLFIIKDNLKVAGISRERYFELLQKI